ncbi:MAG: DNA methyltransferase [Alphaproteobacteria bacterium]
MENALYYGDNLKVLRESIKDETVDLIYLDPPFNSQATYNMLFQSPNGRQSQAQIEAFEDTWHWTTHEGGAAQAFDEVLSSAYTQAAELLRAMRGFLGENDMMAYLAMMAVRLIELRRVLKPTGSLYLHCDPTASHYLKALLDAIFGVAGFANEIIWRRTTPKGLAFSRYAANHDVLLFYRRGDTFTWNPQYMSYSEEYAGRYNLIDEKTGRRFQATSLLNPSPNRPNLTYEFHGHTRVWRWTKERMLKAEKDGVIYFPPGGGVPREKRFFDEQEGVPVSSVWIDIPTINAVAQERLGYPTQKPLALLERIISASSNEGDLVLDPFCGCGTAIHAAEKLRRKWIGIDITHLAISLIERRLKDAFPGISYEVHGTPKDLAGAQDLAKRDKYQFQWWAVGAIGARPWGGKKKGPDTGIDGILYFKPDGKTTEAALVSVKGGETVGVSAVRDLHSVVEREKAKIGVLITAALPTRAMEKEAAATGFYKCDAGEYPRIQIITLAELFQGKRPRIPLVDTAATFKTAKREDRHTQKKLDL